MEKYVFRIVTYILIHLKLIIIGSTLFLSLYYNSIKIILINMKKIKIKNYFQICLLCNANNMKIIIKRNEFDNACYIYICI